MTRCSGVSSSYQKRKSSASASRQRTLATVHRRPRLSLTCLRSLIQVPTIPEEDPAGYGRMVIGVPSDTLA